MVYTVVVYIGAAQDLELLLRPAPLGTIVQMMDSASLQGMIVVHHLRTALGWMTVKNKLTVTVYVLGTHG